MKFTLRKKRSEGTTEHHPEEASASAEKTQVRPRRAPSFRLNKKSNPANDLKKCHIPAGSYFILSIGDEGAILSHIKNKSMEGRWFASTPSEENLSVFSKAIATDTKAALLIVLDTMDQIYTQHTLPPVSKMSLGGLLKRRIRREFSDTELKGSYLIDRTDSKEWNFMLFAIDQQEHTKAWISWATEQQVKPLGIRALPLEMASLSNMLYAAREKPEQELTAENDKEWTFVVSHNKVSGFRQTIMRNGKMIFTRLSQPLEGEEAMQAGIIEQEITSTIEYLKRIGLRSYHDMHLNVIASSAIIALIDVKKLGVQSYELFSPYDVSQKFSWDSVIQPEDRYCDVFVGVFSLTNKKSLAKLWTRQTEKLSKLYKISPVIRATGALVSLVLFGFSLYSVYEWWQAADEAEKQRLRIGQLEADLESVKKNSEMPVEELDRALELSDLYSSIKKQALTPEKFLLDLSSAFANMPQSMRVVSIEWRELSQQDELSGSAAPPSPVADPSQAAAKVSQETPPPGVPVPVSGMLDIRIDVPRNIKNEALIKRANGIIEKLQSYFSFYQISLKDIPGASNAEDTLSIDLSQPDKALSAPMEGEYETRTITVMFQGTEYLSGEVLEE